MKSTIAKKTEGYGYKYTELADINKYCEDNNITYYQEIETNETNGKDYIITTIKSGDDTRKVRGCQIVDAVLQGIKNPVQEYGSSLTYCRRYSLLMALGLATEDDDGARFTKKEVDDFKEHNNLERALDKLIEDNGIDYDKLVEAYKTDDIHKMSVKQIKHAIANIDKFEKVS